MRQCVAIGLMLGLLAVFAAPAGALHHLMVVNEVQLSEGGDPAKQFVELIDPVDEAFTGGPYGISKYDGAGGSSAPQALGGPFATHDKTQPYLLATDTSSAAGARHEPLTIAFPLPSGQVCFYSGGNPANRVNCLRYGTITNPLGDAGNQGATPGTGQSLQVCGGSAVVAAPTPKAANNCAGAPGGGGPGGGGGTTTDTRKPKAKLGGKRTQDIDKLAVTVTLDEAGTVSATGSVNVPGSAKVYRFRKATKTARAGRRVTLRLRLSRKGKRGAKRALRAGRKLRAKIKVTGTDRAKNRTTTRKTVRLKS